MAVLALALDNALEPHLFHREIMGRPYRRIRPRPALPQRAELPENLAALEQRLGYTFHDRDLLREALTHQSWLEANAQGGDSYQRLEFLGDRVLGLAVADMLFLLQPQIVVGSLSRRLSDLVRAETCAEVADEWSLPDHIRFGANIGADTRGSRSVFADVCEAVLGAIYLDGGYEASAKVVQSFWRPRLKQTGAPLKDAKTALQEWVQARGLAPPLYIDLDRSGPDHDPVFKVQVDIPGFEPAAGQASAKKHAQQNAAENFLLREAVWTEGSRFSSKG